MGEKAPLRNAEIRTRRVQPAPKGIVMPIATAIELPPLANDTDADPRSIAPSSGPAPAAVPVGSPELTKAVDEQPVAAGDPHQSDIWDTAGCPPWLAVVLRLVRPLSVGALLAIPTIGAATCGAASVIDLETGLGMARASTAFLQGIPGEVYMLIGFFGGGYGLARTVERLRGARR
jgi:hypothetical protein